MKHGSRPHAGLMALQTRLQLRHAQLRSEIAEALRDSKHADYAELASQVHDRQDESVADLLADVRLAGMDRDLAELRDIEAALARMHAGSYGVCADSGKAVDPQRLEAYPTAKRCFPCQQLHERAHGGARVASL